MIVVTARMRRRVRLLVACKMTEKEIAAACKIAIGTLREHFAEELTNGRALFRRELMEMLETAARKGNVAAMKYLAERTSDEPLSAPVLGKKVEQARAAATAGTGTEWGEIIRAPTAPAHPAH